MPFQIIRNDITKVRCDAIVNAANPTLLGGGGVDGAIHSAAGPELLAECRTLGGCKTGEAKITRGYRLPARYVIHTVGPVWQGGEAGEEALLRRCYRSSLALAMEHGCASVAFPLISAGVYGYPKDQAIAVACEEIRGFLDGLEDEPTVYLVVFDRRSFRLSETLTREIQSFIDDAYTAPFEAAEARRDRRNNISVALPQIAAPMPDAAPAPKTAGKKKSGILARPAKAVQEAKGALWDEGFANAELESLLSQMDESFTQMLLRKIDESGMTDAGCYKKANVDRKLFSKIRSDLHYKPSKATAIAFAIALELPLRETNELLRKAGYALSPSSKFDLIIEYFIRRGNYDVFAINEALFAFDQPLLGG